MIALSIRQSGCKQGKINRRRLKEANERSFGYPLLRSRRQTVPIVMKKLCARWRLRTTSIIFTKPQTLTACLAPWAATVRHLATAMPRAALGEAAGAFEIGGY
jgi:hypothetical protein